MEPNEQKEKIRLIAVIAVIAVAIVGAGYGVLQWSKPKEPVLAGQEKPVVPPDEKDKAVALSYLDAVIKQAQAQGANDILKRILSFAQTEAKDGQPSQPICVDKDGKAQTVQIGTTQFYNVACLKKAEPTPETPSTP